MSRKRRSAAKQIVRRPLGRRIFHAIIALAVVTVLMGSYALYDWLRSAEVGALVTSVSGGPLPDRVLTTLNLRVEDLNPFVDRTDIGSDLRALERRIPALDTLVASTLPFIRDYAFDLVLQNHGEVGESPEAERTTIRSQHRVWRTLESIRPDVVLVEGIPLDRISYNGLRDYAIEQARTMGVFFSRFQYDRGFKNTLAIDGALQYWVKHPNLPMAGSEDNALNIAQLHLLDLLRTMPKSATGDSLDALNRKLGDARSIVALCRSVRVNKVAYGKRAAIVIGSAHGSMMAAILQKLGASYRIYDATK